MNKFTSMLIRWKRQASALAVIIVLQSFCAVFFLVDAVVDLVDHNGIVTIHIIFELVAALALFAGVGFMLIQLRLIIARMDKMETSLQVARGEMADLIDAQFTQWALSPAERDVGIMLVKGLSNEEIAAVRGTAVGTARAQTTAIYTKAGVKSRSQLISYFFEELLADGLDTGEANSIS